jgi:hypothetical protein
MSTQNCLFGLADACLISNDTINGLSVFTYFCGFSSLCNKLNGIYCCFNNNCNTPQNASLIFFNGTTTNTTTTTTAFYYSPTYSFKTSDQTTSFAALNSSNQTATKVGVNMSTSIANITTIITTEGNMNTSIVNIATTTNSKTTTTVGNEASFKSLISTKLIIFKIFFLFVYLL